MLRTVPLACLVLSAGITLSVVGGCAPRVQSSQATGTTTPNAGRVSADAKTSTNTTAHARRSGTKEGVCRCRNQKPNPAASPAQRAIEEALSRKTTLSFVETPLADVVEFLHGEYEINVVLDRRALDDVGIEIVTPVTTTLSDVSLRSALDLMLGSIDLAWTVRSEVLLITTPEEVESSLVTEVYEVADLVASVTYRDEDGRAWEDGDYDTLIHTITSTVEPTSWDEVGGPGSVVGGTFGTAKVLVVSQTYPIHIEIAQLLENLRCAARRNATGKQPGGEPSPHEPGK